MNKIADLAIVILGITHSVVFASECSCPAPPGGHHDCENDQFAVCKVENNQCHGSCVDGATVLYAGDLSASFEKLFPASINQSITVNAEFLGEFVSELDSGQGPFGGLAYVWSQERSNMSHDGLMRTGLNNIESLSITVPEDSKAEFEKLIRDN